MAALEQWQKETNNNIAAIQELLNTNDRITSVTPVTMSGNTVGYTISFLNSDPITLYNGEKGEAGDTPQIGLTQDDAGDWYWTLNGELMRDANGDPIRANGEDGKDGQDGADGDDGATGPAGPQGKPGTSAPTPQIKLGKEVTGTIADGGTKDDDAWYLSVDGGATWYRVSGSDGTAGDAFFTQAPETNEEEGTVTFYLSDGKSFTVPLFRDYVYDKETNTYTVHSAAGLQAWAVAARSAAEDGKDVNCILANDIDMTGQVWETIAQSNNYYKGTIDGAGHTISNLQITDSSCGIVDTNQGTIKNLTIVNPTISGSFYTGVIAACNKGTIENCHIIGGTVNCSGGQGGGGITSLNDKKIIACSSSATVSNTYTSGGIAGTNNGQITACYVTGTVTGDKDTGAIAGRTSISQITACYWSGETAAGIGSASGGADNAEATQVTDEVTWETAMEAMNTALATAGYGYKWVENTNAETKETHPLIVEEITR